MVGRLTGLACAFLVCGLVFACYGDSPELPDFSVKILSIDPPSVFRGVPTVVTFALTQTGLAGQVESVVVEVTCRRYDLERDCFVERRIVQLAGASARASTFIIATNDFPAGDYEVSLRVDPDDDIAETSETNNRAIAQLVVVSPRCDLVPTGLMLEPQSPIEIGSTLRITANVANTGAAATSGFAVICEIQPPGADGWMSIGSANVPGLERDDEAVIRFSYEVSPSESGPPGLGDAVEGHYGIRVRTDPDDAVAEKDETNNGLTTSFTVVPNERQRPDLRPVSLTLSPSSPLGWLRDATATVVVENIGGAATGDPVEVAFYYRRAGTDDPSWQPLRDPESGVCDPSLWDLAIRSPAHGQPLSIEEGSNTETLQVMIRFSEHEVERSCTGETGETTIWPARILPGDYELKVVVDPVLDSGSSDGKERERYENNNELIVGFSIVGSELQPEGLELSQSSVDRGTDVVVRATVRNTGDKTADAFTVGFFVDARRMDTYYYNGQGLATDDVVSVQGVIETQDLLEGEHMVRVVVDPDDRLYEHDEANNTVSTPFTVTELSERRAELFVDRMVLRPASPMPTGSPFVIRAAINNAGDLAAEGFDVRLRLAQVSDSCTTPVTEIAETDPVLEVAIPVRQLEPSEVLWLEWSIAGRELGVYEVTVVLDPDDGKGFATDPGQVPELDEQNNTMSARFAVCDTGDAETPPPVQPNLVCQGLAVTPEEITPGSPVTITARIANQGREPASAFDVAVEWVFPTGHTQRIEILTVGPLQPGGSVQYERTIDTSGLPYGSHHVALELDVGGDVDEASETDNYCNAAAWIGGGEDGDPVPDLVPISVRFDSPGAAIGEDNAVEMNQRLYVHVTIRNSGNIPSGPFSVAFETSRGIETESWTSVGPLDQVEVSYPIPTDVPGSYALSIAVDPDGLIPEADETNNSIPNAYVEELPTYVVLPPEIPVPEEIVPASSSAGAARWLQADDSSGLLYVASTNGMIRRFDFRSESPVESVTEVSSLGATITDVAWSLGATPYAYVGTSADGVGAVHCVNLGTGAVIAEASPLGDPPVALAPGSAGQVFVAVDGGFHRLTLVGSEFQVSRMVGIDGDILDILYDAERSTIYVLSTAGVHAYSAALELLCTLDAGELVGAPSVLSLAGSGVYIGTDAGTGGIVYAASHCTLAGGVEGRMLIGWRYPRSGTLPGNVTSIVIDPRDIDPVYVGTDAGFFYSLGFDGGEQWGPYSAGAAIRSTPVADKRSGRIFFGDDAGVPHVLTLDGGVALEIDLTEYDGSAIRSTLVIVETRERTDSGTRFMRNYYYGTETGAVYRIASNQ